MPDAVNAGPQTVAIPNVQLETIEKAIFSREYETASRELLTALRKIKAGAQFIGYVPDLEVQKILYSRLAAAIIALLSDPKFGLSQEGFDHFASEHAIIDTVFRNSVFLTSDHMLPMLSTNPDETDRTKLQVSDGSALVKFLLTYSLRSGFGLNFEETFGRSPQIMIALWSGMISPLMTIAVHAHERREHLLGLHTLFKDVDLPEAAMPALSDAYMYSSYGTRPDKHAMKATVHALMERTLRSRGVKIPDDTVMLARRADRPVLGDSDRRPTILICLEWFGHMHAMFRCYAPMIRELRPFFRLVGMSQAGSIDEQGKAVFDEWVEVPSDGLVLRDLVKKIVSEIRPDMIYYPSIGMAMWWVALASVRLAPIQFMTLGHPASSHSKCIDYAISEEGTFGDPAQFTERLIEIPRGSARFVMRPDGENLQVFPMENDPVVVRVAVPAMVCKLNAPFMETLREIANTPRLQRVEFHFFINMIGANLNHARREILDWIPNAVVHQRATYEHYMSELRRCHVHMSTFPFGGTNSNIDSMLLGVPILTLEGTQPHARFDAAMLRHAGMPEFLIAKTREEYVAMGNRLISDNDLRMSLHRKLVSTDLKGLFFGQPPGDRRNSFLRAVTMIYDQHEALQQGERVIRIEPQPEL